MSSPKCKVAWNNGTTQSDSIQSTKLRCGVRSLYICISRKTYCTSSFFFRNMSKVLLNSWIIWSLPEEERVLFDRRLADVVDYSKRREWNINQFKKEKELRGRIEVTIILLVLVRVDWLPSTENSEGEGTNSNFRRHWFRSHFFSPALSFIY